MRKVRLCLVEHGSELTFVILDVTKERSEEAIPKALEAELRRKLRVLGIKDWAMVFEELRQNGYFEVESFHCLKKVLYSGDGGR